MAASEPSPTPDLGNVRQRRNSVRAAMTALEDALASPAVGQISQWDERVRIATAELTVRMQQHVEATEGPDGFHNDILSAAPRLAHQVEVSCREHKTITELLARLTASGDARTADDVDGVREIGTNLLALLSRHRQRGSDMIYAAYQDDIGGET